MLLPRWAAFAQRGTGTLATTVAMISDGLSHAELVALRHIGYAVALGDEQIATIVSEVDNALGRGKRRAA